MKKDYNNNIKKIAKLMSLESKVNIVGSAKVKRSIFYSDYDSFSTVKGKNDNMIYNHFKSLFKIIKSSENTIIIYFKMGEFKDKALRWDYEAINRRENIHRNNGTSAFHGGVLAQNGKIYCIPHFSAKNVVVIDPETNTTETIIMGLTDRNVKYGGGVLAPNGKIYGIPINVDNVLMINSGLPKYPDWMLQAYFNKF
jgi:hypothetical protein